MNTLNGFLYVTKDPKWPQKVLIGGLIMAVPILDVIANGYQMQVIRNLLDRQTHPLPPWQGIDKLFGNGLRLYLAVLMLYIPAIILQVIGWFAGLSSLYELLFSINNATAQTKATVYAGSFLARLIVSGLTSLLSLALPIAFLLVPAMVLCCAKTNSLRKTFNFGKHAVFVLRHLGDYVLSMVSVLVALFFFSFLATLVGGVTFFIVGLGGWLVLSVGRFWSRMMWAYYLANIEMKNVTA
jgi:hypothetical protein